MMELWNDIEKKKDAKKIKILFDRRWKKSIEFMEKIFYVIGLYCVKYDLCLIKTTKKKNLFG